MTWPTIRYRVGNEHNPADPWGRSELVIHPDGSARLDHHFSMGGDSRALLIEHHFTRAAKAWWPAGYLVR